MLRMGSLRRGAGFGAFRWTTLLVPVLAFGCSTESQREEPASSAQSALQDNGAARARLELIRAQVRMPHDLASRPAAVLPPHVGITGASVPATELVPVIGSGEVERFEPSPGAGLLAVVDAEADPTLLRRRARVELPPDASQPVVLSDPETGVAIAFAVDGAAPASRQLVDGIALYTGVTSDGADLAHRPFLEGTEDYFYFPTRPREAAIRYRVDVSRAPGLRLVENVLEFLNAEGDPRLRMTAPYLVDADGELQRPRVSVEGCAVDTNPEAPWGRAITPPGGEACLVTVAWDDAQVRYPAVLDPGWTTTGSLVTARMLFTATRIAGNIVLIAGGAGNLAMTIPLNSAELYNVSTGTSATTGSLTTARSAHAATLLPTGRVIVSGGWSYGSPTPCLSSAEVYVNGVWYNTGNSMKAARRFHTATLLYNLQVLMVGGLSGTNCDAATSTTDIYNPTSGSYGAFQTGTTPVLNAGQRAYHTATTIPFGAHRVLIAGGVNGAGTAYGAADVYTESTNSFSTTGASDPRVRHAATLTELNGPCAWGDCRVILLAGGQSSVGGTALNTLEYWADDGVFHDLTATLSSARGAIAGASVNGPSSTNNILITGGVSGSTYRADANILRTSFTSTIATLDAGSMGGSRAYHQATTVSYGGGTDNAVVVCGGGNPGALRTCARYVLQANGSTCTAAGQCESRNCVDGVCCDTSCTGAPCMACSAAKTGGTDGQCAPVAAGSDLDGECAASAPESCGLTGECSGVLAGSQSTCQLHPDTTICVEEHCNGSTLEWTKCDGAGVCNQPGSKLCTPYACVQVVGPDACGTICSVEGDCAPGQFCNGGVCLSKVVQGGTCNPATVGQCVAGLTCVDGVCCESDCNSLCYACTTAKTGQANGLCRAVTAGTDLDEECTQADATTCGNDGMCNGSGACRKYGPTVECGKACQTDNAYLKHCNGGGACIQDSSVDAYCSPYACNLTTGECRITCADSTQCQPGTTGRYCLGGACLDKKPVGELCGSSAECTSTFCVDSVCCDALCNGLCHACSALLKGGGADGTCEPVYAQKDPSNECEDKNPCAENGFCNGQGACGLYPVGTNCGTIQCVGTISTGQMCNGSGTCINNTTGQECSPYVCQTGVGCLAACAGDQDCVQGHFCNSLLQCVAKLTNGKACTAASQCASNHCVDQVCCNQACGSMCFACTAAKKGSGQDGDCAEVESGADPDNDCDDEGVCGLDGTCNGLGGCRLYVANTPCGAGAVCDNNVAKGQMCNGSGSCVDLPTGTDCTPHVCQDGVGCSTPCASGVDCLAGYYCATAGDCLPTKSDGSPCDTNAECASTHCVDGVCCNTGCSDPCQGCSAATKQSGADGLCGPARAGIDPHDDCTENPATSCSFDGECDGAGACRLYAPGTACGLTSCDGNVVKGQTCNGTGDCVANPGGTDCAPYVCQNSQCLTSCTTAGDCVSGNQCVNNACSVPGQLGTPCTVAGQCGSGWCVDGVCCNEACDGQCEACSVAGSVGLCSAVTGMPLGTNREPCAGAAPCKGSCDGSERDACVYPGSAVICSSSCANAEATVAACDGSGECGVEAVQPCDPYICEDTSSCKTTCSDSSDCVEPAECDATGHCVEPGPDGGTGGAAGAGGAGGSAGAGGTGTGGAQSDAGSDAAAPPPPVVAAEDSGCGCRVQGSGESWSQRWAIAALLLCGLAVRRRRHPSC